MPKIAMAGATELADDAQIAQARAVGEPSPQVPRAVVARYLPQREHIETIALAHTT